MVDTFLSVHNSKELVDWVAGIGKNLTTIYIDELKRAGQHSRLLRCHYYALVAAIGISALGSAYIEWLSDLQKQA